MLRRVLDDPLLDVMNFLNEIAIDFPDAISLAAGRPPGDLFDLEHHTGGLARYVKARAHGAIANGAATNGADATDEAGRLSREWNALGAYNRTNGIIQDAVARHLAADEGIDVAPDAIAVTVGAQEAMAILLLGLFEPGRDILLVSDPAYIGITALARLMGIRVWPVPMGDSGLEADAVEAAIVQASRQGRAVAIYDVPDFNNPLGTQMPLGERRRLLAVCRRHGLLIFEDNPYGMFAYDDGRLPTLKALDDGGETVVYIGSFAKTLFPALRLGYLVADQRIEAAGGGVTTLASALARVKSLTTVNTSTVLQAMAAGVLQEAGDSLASIVEPKRQRLRRCRDVLLEALADAFGGDPRVTWNRPPGGFFLTVSLPFAFGMAEARRCAEACGVLVVPLQCLSLGGGREHQIRLSFGSAGEREIREGARRLARFVSECGPARRGVSANVM